MLQHYFRIKLYFPGVGLRSIISVIILGIFADTANSFQVFAPKEKSERKVHFELHICRWNRVGSGLNALPPLSTHRCLRMHLDTLALKAEKELSLSSWHFLRDAINASTPAKAFCINRCCVYIVRFLLRQPVCILSAFRSWHPAASCSMSLKFIHVAPSIPTNSMANL